MAERDHRLGAVRDWVAQRSETVHTLLDITRRDTDGTDDRLGTVLSMMGDETTQAVLDGTMLQNWRRVDRLPTATMRVASPRGSVSQDPTDEESRLQQGHSTDHRPDLRQCTALRATLAPLGLPLVCQPVAGHHADAGV